MGYFYITRPYDKSCVNETKMNVLESASIMHDKKKPGIAIFVNPRLVKQTNNSTGSIIIHKNKSYLVEKVMTEYWAESPVTHILNQPARKKNIQQLNYRDYQTFHYAKFPKSLSEDIDVLVHMYYHDLID